ncbi:hypothetical protein [uncultured Bacteroides sp.]|uniref:hypothetical protein n=1 Tax=uncultured Bacteroides sp. TaxID=162156 RepID=UPI0026060E94|nr:hypothetical protein [uncultured Bacteroides sp.]
MKNVKLRCILSLVGLMTMVYLFSQDKHSYATPLGKSVFHRDVTDANRTVLRMNEVSPLSSGTDGLVVAFSMRQNLSQVTRPLKLLSFNSTSEEENSHLEVYYHEGTITLRRKMAPRSELYYDYNLYDPMFTVDEGVTTWEVRLFFTGYFLWIETRDTHKLLNNKWHAPIFFGINLPQMNYMGNYLARSSSSYLIFGDPNPSTTFTMPDEIAIYEFKYAELKNELQTNFCEDN